MYKMQITLSKFLVDSFIKLECETDKISGLAYALETLLFKLDEDHTEENKKKNWLALINISAILQEYISTLSKDINEMNTFSPINKEHFKIILENK